jgi:hypothetical protein
MANVRRRDGLMGDPIPLIGGLLTIDEDVHGRARRLIQAVFSRRTVAQQVGVDDRDQGDRSSACPNAGAWSFRSATA